MDTVPLTDLDRRILAALAEHGRLPYQELARIAGAPASTCHGRVRRMEEQGVIRGYRADIDPAALGRGVSALVMVSVRSDRRSRVPQVAEQVRQVPGVQQVFLIGGTRDLVVHVACRSVRDLRALVTDHFGGNPYLDRTQTELVFDHWNGADPAG